MLEKLMKEAETNAVKNSVQNTKEDDTKVSHQCISALTDSRRARSQKANMSRKKHNEYIKILEKELARKKQEVQTLHFERNMIYSHNHELRKNIQSFAYTTDAEQQKSIFRAITNLLYPVPGDHALQEFDEKSITEQEYGKAQIISDRELCNGSFANLTSVSDFEMEEEFDAEKINLDSFILGSESVDLYYV